jgi:hypothetical protein
LIITSPLFGAWTSICSTTTGSFNPRQITAFAFCPILAAFCVVALEQWWQCGRAPSNSFFGKPRAQTPNLDSHRAVRIAAHSLPVIAISVKSRWTQPDLGVTIAA